MMSASLDACTRPTTSIVVRLAAANHSIEDYRVHEPEAFSPPTQPFRRRPCFAAPHVVADARAEYTPGALTPIDWDATIAFRRHLWRFGLGVAEAMDTAERGPHGLRWATARELIRQSSEAAADADGLIMCGAGTDQIVRDRPSLDEIIDAYVEQVGYIEEHGSSAILRVSYELSRVASGTDDYLRVYEAVLAQAKHPVVVHWLGSVFDPSLSGYWGQEDLDETMNILVELSNANRGKLAGIKVSVLDAAREIELRRRLSSGVQVYTGDDYNYPALILGDGERYSLGLLGVLDPIAPLASAALQALDLHSEQQYLTLMKSTVPLAMRMFEEPAGFYKSGVVLLSWLAGYQEHFRMVSGDEGRRSAMHYAELFRIADRLGLFPDPEVAAHRIGVMMAISGIA
jgi:hypothetical protein